MKLILKNSILIVVAIIFSTNVAIAESEGDISGNQSYNVRVVLDHIFISMNNDSIGITEIAVFRNEGQDIYYTGDNHTYFAISTPPGVKNLKTDVMECCLVQEEGIVYMDPMKSIKAGENFEMKISYEIELCDKKHLFNKSTVYNTTSVSLFVDKKSGVSVEGIHKTITLSGKEYYTIGFEGLKPGDPVEIPLMITPQTSYYYFYAVSGLIILLFLASVYYFRKRLFRRKGKYRLEELELEKLKIFQAIRGFEKHAGGESSEEHMRLMQEYRQKGMDIIMKIDKIK